MSFTVITGGRQPHALRTAEPTRASRRRGHLTPVRHTDTATPHSGGRRQVWEARSLDGQWRYVRRDDAQIGPRVWDVVYVPTGQLAPAFRSLIDAREATGCGELLNAMKLQAYGYAYGNDPARHRDGQQLLAIHARVSGHTEVEFRCACGGTLAHLGGGARLGHVDACDECVEILGDLNGSACDLRKGHKFCGAPTKVDCAHLETHGCIRAAAPNRGRGCPLDNADDCCMVCCSGD